ncbi:MAG TPA: Xaa-Pro peptidase family protein [Thermaerobacter sp.]
MSTGTDGSDRLASLQALLEEAGTDLLAVTPGTSCFYLTGVQLLGSRLALFLLPRRGEPAWVLPKLEASRVAAAPGAAGTPPIFAYADGEDPGAAVGEAIRHVTASLGGPPRVAAMEERVARLFEWRVLAAALPSAEWRAADSLLARLRARKDAREIAAIRRAAGLVETALAHAARFVSPGWREDQIATEVEKALRQLGTHSPFGIHVASGPRSAVPHAETGDRVLEPGDLVWIDVGASVDGYASDITRTFLLPADGPETGDYALRREIYAVCYRAQAAARAAARPGARAGDVDAAARQVIEAAGYGEFFTHRTGHGLGLDVHEAPDIAPGSDTVLEPGMVFTIEPGIYVPGVGGVRIEDDILITEDGSRSLTRFERWLAPGPAPAGEAGEGH